MVTPTPAAGPCGAVLHVQATLLRVATGSSLLSSLRFFLEGLLPSFGFVVSAAGGPETAERSRISPLRGQAGGGAEPEQNGQRSLSGNDNSNDYYKRKCWCNIALFG